MEEGEVPSTNSTQKRLYAFGGKEEIPNKRRSGRDFVSVRKGSVPPFRLKGGDFSLRSE